MMNASEPDAGSSCGDLSNDIIDSDCQMCGKELAIFCSYLPHVNIHAVAEHVMLTCTLTRLALCCVQNGQGNVVKYVLY